MFIKITNLSAEARTQICKDLWAVEPVKNNCRCGAAIGEDHIGMCDVARCGQCGGQAISCGCTEANHDVWTGYWPGIEYCYDNEIICLDSSTGQVQFDLNEGAVRHMRELAND